MKDQFAKIFESIPTRKGKKAVSIIASEIEASTPFNDVMTVNLRFYVKGIGARALLDDLFSASKKVGKK